MACTSCNRSKFAAGQRGIVNDPAGDDGSQSGAGFIAGPCPVTEAGGFAAARPLRGVGRAGGSHGVRRAHARAGGGDRSGADPARGYRSDRVSAERPRSGWDHVPASVPMGIDRNQDLILTSPRGELVVAAGDDVPGTRGVRHPPRRLVSASAPSTGDQQAQAAQPAAIGWRPVPTSGRSTPSSAYDLADLRGNPGIRQWNVFSVSYGTYLALTYMRLDAGGNSSVVLDGVTPPSAATPGWTWSSVREAFDNMTQACAAQPACNARYPDLARTFIEQVGRLEAHPVTTTVAVPRVGDVTVVLDGGALLDWFAPKWPASLPRVSRGGRSTGARQSPADRRAGGDQGRPRPGRARSGGPAAQCLLQRVGAVRIARRGAASGTPGISRFSRLSVRAQLPQMPFIRQKCKAWNVPKASRCRPSLQAPLRRWCSPTVTTRKRRSGPLRGEGPFAFHRGDAARLASRGVPPAAPPRDLRLVRRQSAAAGTGCAASAQPPAHCHRPTPP